MHSKLLTASDVARHFNLSPETVYRLTRQGILPAIRIGRSYRYELVSLETWKTENSTLQGEK